MEKIPVFVKYFMRFSERIKFDIKKYLLLLQMGQHQIKIYRDLISHSDGAQKHGGWHHSKFSHFYFLGNGSL